MGLLFKRNTLSPTSIKLISKAMNEGASPRIVSATVNELPSAFLAEWRWFLNVGEPTSKGWLTQPLKPHASGCAGGAWPYFLHGAGHRVPGRSAGMQN